MLSRRSSIGGRLACAVFVALCLAGCRKTPRQRPQGIPAAARFVGGDDGGAFLYCFAVDVRAETYRCRVYDEFTGSLQRDSLFRLAGRGTVKVDFTDADSMTSWDGTSIWFRGGAQLQRVKP